MEQKDLKLIEKVMKENPELAELWSEHQGFERRLEKLERKPFLKPEEQQERNELKKRKLAGRDHIESILEAYRDNGAGS